MRTSIIIPTYNRPESFKKTIYAIEKQSILPSEIIVVDDSTDNQTQVLCMNLKKRTPQIKWIYIKKNPAERGTSRSRNLGILKAKGDFLFFLDDDILIHKEYVASSINYFEKNPQANGIQWFAYSNHDYKYDYNRIKNYLMKIFFLSYYKQDVSKVLPSMNPIIPYPLTKDIPTEFMGAGTSVIKKKSLGNLRFDEKLTGYALQEDLDFSYRLHKKVGGLYLLKERKVHHAYELGGRPNLKKIMYTKFVYLSYLFKKNMPQTYISQAIFWWSMFGRVILRFPNLIVRPKKATFLEALYSIQAIVSVIFHFSSLEKNPNYFKTEA